MCLPCNTFNKVTFGQAINAYVGTSTVLISLAVCNIFVFLKLNVSLEWFHFESPEDIRNSAK
jgi:hypothetical protein